MREGYKRSGLGTRPVGGGESSRIPQTAKLVLLSYHSMRWKFVKCFEGEFFLR